MRKAFFDTLMDAARNDSSLWFLTADVGFSVIEPFQEAFPDRFLNVGIAEQNMVGIAAGLALSGKRVFVYSIGNFVTLRCLEQIRNDVCYHKLPVTLVGTGSGLVYGTQGYTHHITEDIAATRALPGLRVFAPADPVEAAAITRFAATNNGPNYIRLAKAGEPRLHETPLDQSDIVKALVLREGQATTLIATGNSVGSALEAAKILRTEGIEARVISLPCLAPLDKTFLRAEAHRVPLIATLEEHGLAGGLGEAVGAILAEEGGARLLRFGIDARVIDGHVGTQADLRRLFGLAPDQIAAKIKQRLSGN